MSRNELVLHRKMFNLEPMIGSIRFQRVMAVLVMIAMTGLAFHAPMAAEMEPPVSVVSQPSDHDACGSDPLDDHHRDKSGALSCASMIGHCATVLGAALAQLMPPQLVVVGGVDRSSFLSEGLTPDAESPPPRV